MSQDKKPIKLSVIILAAGAFAIFFIVNPGMAQLALIILLAIFFRSPYFKNKSKALISESLKSSGIGGLKDLEMALNDVSNPVRMPSPTQPASAIRKREINFFAPKKINLQKNHKYLQVALNGTLGEAREVISTIPESEKIIIEAGTPLIKSQGEHAIRQLKYLRPDSYIVADIKTADLAEREVAMVSGAGASAATCLGVAPIETIDEFIAACGNYGIDSMIDMMNVESPLLVLKKLKRTPDVVMLHRGVDETEFSKGKMLPFYQIKQIKGNYNVKVSVAGGDTLREVQSAIFNDADIVVVWKNFTRTDKKTGRIIQGFLKEIR